MRQHRVKMPSFSTVDNVEDILENNNNNNNNNKCEKKDHFPYSITKVDPELNAQLLKDFTGERTGFVQVGPKKWFFPSGYEKEARNYYNFEVRPDDVWVVTYPRSGTTWTQEMVWLLANNLDFNTAAQIPLTTRFPFLEFSMFVHPETKKQFLQENSHCKERQAMVEAIAAPCWKLLQQQSSRRFIKTHFPFSLLPPNLLTSGCKVIYVARNPKDVAVSFYHLNRLIRTQGYVGNFEKYWDYFEKNLQAWSPYWEHLKEGWDQKNSENVLFMFYEEMNKDLPGCIEKLGEFLNKKLTNEQISQLENHLKIENFRNNSSVNFDVLKHVGILNKGEEGFVRKGKTGSWKDLFTPELIAKADQWIHENLKNTDMRFPS